MVLWFHLILFVGLFMLFGFNSVLASLASVRMRSLFLMTVLEKRGGRKSKPLGLRACLYVCHHQSFLLNRDLNLRYDSSPSIILERYWMKSIDHNSLLCHLPWSWFAPPYVFPLLYTTLIILLNWSLFQWFLWCCVHGTKLCYYHWTVSLPLTAAAKYFFSPTCIHLRMKAFL